jgi:hypothetical protein
LVEDQERGTIGEGHSTRGRRGAKARLGARVQGHLHLFSRLAFEQDLGHAVFVRAADLPPKGANGKGYGRRGAHQENDFALHRMATKCDGVGY